MSLNESIVEDAALEWFREHFRCASSLIPAFSQREKEEDKAIRRLNPAIPEEARSTLANSATGQTGRSQNP